MKRFLIPILILAGFLALGGLFGLVFKTHKIIERTVCTSGEVVKETSATALTLSLRQPGDIVDEKTVTCPKHKKTGELYDEAVEAAKAGQPAKVDDLVGRMVELDPKMSRNDLLADIRGAAGNAAAIAVSGSPAGSQSGGSAGGAASGGTAGGTSPGSGGLAADAPLQPLLPSSLPGFTKSSGEGDKDTATAVFKSAEKRGIVSLITTVRRARDESSAKRFIETTQPMVYPDDTASLEVAGRPAHFGTNRSGYAALAWYNGRYTFEILMTVREVKPGTMFNKAKELGEAFPKP